MRLVHFRCLGTFIVCPRLPERTPAFCLSRFWCHGWSKQPFPVRRTPMKTHVSFKRDSVTINKEFPPFGEDIAAAMVASFASQGLGDCSVETLDYAFSCFAPAGARRCCVMLGLVGDDPQQWLISCDSRRGILDWFRRKNSAEIHTLVKAIHYFLSGDSAVSEIRWYTADGWNKDPDTWTSSP